MKIFHRGIEYDKTSIYDISIKESVSLTSNELTSNTCSFKLKVRSELLEFKKGDQVIIIDDNNTLFGEFYVAKSKMIHKDSLKVIFTVECEDIITKLDRYDYNGYYYNGEKLGDVMGWLVEGTNIIIEVPQSLYDIKLYGHNKRGTKRTALHNICFAYGLIIDTSRTNKIVLKQLKDTTVAIIDKNDLFEDDVDVKEVVEGVSVTAYNYKFPTELTEEVVLFEGNLTQKTMILFEPHSNLRVENCTLGRNCNSYAELEILEGNTEVVKLYGKPLSKTEIAVNTGDINSGIVVSDNELINLLNVSQVADNLLNNLKDSHTANITARYNSLRCGDRVIVNSRLGIMFGRIVEQTINFSNSLHLADIIIEGKLTPPQEKYYTPNDLRTNDNLGLH